jgi:AcrR family transcriptional regulator
MIDLAEQLFGERGIDAVPLQQISLRAGSRNRTAIQYHFRDTEGLIRTILLRRMPLVDQERGEKLDVFMRSGKPIDCRTMMNILYLPVINHFSDAGYRAHARFMLSLLTSNWVHVPYDLFESLQPNAFRVIRLLVDATGISEPLLLERQRLVAIMVLTSIFNRLSYLAAPEWDEALIENVLAMATSAIAAPVDPKVARDISASY